MLLTCSSGRVAGYPWQVVVSELRLLGVRGCPWCLVSGKQQTAEVLGCHLLVATAERRAVEVSGCHGQAAVAEWQAKEVGRCHRWVTTFKKQSTVHFAYVIGRGFKYEFPAEYGKHPVFV